MTVSERIVRLAAPVLGACSVLMILAASNLLFAGWLFFTRGTTFWATFWTASGAALAAYGVVSLLALARRIPAPLMDAARPVLMTGAVLLALAGAAWPIQTEIRWRRTGDFEAYGVVIGLVMLAEGVAAFTWLALAPREAPR